MDVDQMQAEFDRLDTMPAAMREQDYIQGALQALGWALGHYTEAPSEQEA